MQEIKQLLPVSWLAVTPYKLAHPLRSSPITGPSSLLQDDPPPSCASILSPFVVLTYRVFSYHHRKGCWVDQPLPAFTPADPIVRLSRNGLLPRVTQGPLRLSLQV